MRKLIIFLFIFSTLASVKAQDTLKIEFGFKMSGVEYVAPPNSVLGWGSAGNGTYGEDLVFHFAEIGNSYNGNLTGSQWISYGSMMSAQQYPYLEYGLGFYPDTIKYFFINSTELNMYFTDSVGNSDSLQTTWELFPGSGSFGIDSMMAIVPSLNIEYSHNIQVNNAPIITSTNEIKTNQNIDIYPNPTNGFVYINTGNYDRIEILTLQGKMLLNFQKKGRKLDLSELPTGIYIARIYNEGFVFNKKITKL